MLILIVCFVFPSGCKSLSEVNSADDNKNMTNLEMSDFDATVFVGTWCGKWDNKYPLCLSFGKKDGKNELLAEVDYRWKEQVNGEFYDTVKIISSFTASRLEVGNITFQLDRTEHNRAKVIGHFSRKERSADLTKQTLQSTKTGIVNPQ
jgi:hypothetical protein